MTRNFKLLSYFYCVYPLGLVLANIYASAKIIQLIEPINLFGYFVFSGTIAAGTLLFPITFVCGDIITEVYGPKENRKLIWLSFFSLLFVQALTWFVGALPGASFWHNQEAYDKIFNQIWRVNLGSFISFPCGTLANSYVMWMMKRWHGEKKLGWRFIASTMVGEAIDTVLFLHIAFFGIFPYEDLVKMMFFNWLVKVIWECIALPITIPLVNKIKQYEHSDFTDVDGDQVDDGDEGIQVAI